jgi:hypothetical protein
MALHDYRRLVDLPGPAAGADFVAVEIVEHDRPILLHVQGAGAGVRFLLSEGDAGAIMDALAGALRILAAPA